MNRLSPRRKKRQSGGRWPSAATDDEVALLLAQRRSGRLRTAFAVLGVSAAAAALTVWALTSSAGSSSAERSELPAAQMKWARVLASGEPAPRASAITSRSSTSPSMDLTTLAALPEKDAVIPTVRMSRARLRELASSLAAQKAGAVQLCFERELKRDPRVSGNVTVEIDLKPPKTVDRIAVLDTLGRGRFTRCVRGAMASLRVPALSEEVSLQLPFALKNPEL